MKIFQKLKNKISKAVYTSLFKFIFILTRIINNRIVAISMTGNNYGCNPKAITDALLKTDSQLEIFWVFKKNRIPDSIDKKIHIVKYRSLYYYYIISTSKVIINNQRFLIGKDFLKRKGQIYIQTWHGTALKKIEKDAIQVLGKDYYNNAIKDSSSWDIAISDSAYHTKTLKDAFWYSGKILEVGMPRNDIFFLDTSDIKKKIHDYYKIPENSHIILYAPTFRNNNEYNEYQLNSDLILKHIENRFSGKWFFLVRFHPNMIDNPIYDTFFDFSTSNVIDVTLYPDMQELLTITNILITDYSSSIFDYLATKNPCFLYTPDIESYDRGFYMNIKTLPFSYSLNEKELLTNIDKFDYNIYKEKIDSFNRDFLHPYTNKDSSKTVASYIMASIGK